MGIANDHSIFIGLCLKPEPLVVLVNSGSLVMVPYRKPEIIQGSMKLGRLWVSELKSISL